MDMKAFSTFVKICPGWVRSEEWSGALLRRWLPRSRCEGVCLPADRADEAQGRLKLLYDASVRMGATLDVTRTAEELSQVPVPVFADFVTVDLTESVLRGEEPSFRGDMKLRRIAIDGIRDDFPFYPRGRWFTVHRSTPQATGLGGGPAVLASRLDDVPGWRAQDPERSKWIVEYGVHSLITVPLCSRGAIFGVVDFWRSEKPEPFDADDLSFAEELVGHAAVSIDNAHCYTCEHVMAATLQHSLLPHCLPHLSALDVAHRYLPAQAGVGGDWFDVLPLPGARVALVVGDVVGHGLRAAATMGQLRTAVHNFSSLDVPPDELLGHLDELVSRADCRESAVGGEGFIGGATCLYAIYDPVSRRCVMSRAGHPPPALVRPDGRVEFLDVPVGPPLGLGSLPFETTEWEVPEGSQLVLYTDGLIEDRNRDIDVGLALLRAALTRAAANRPQEPEETCTAVLDAMLPARHSDDVALLVACTHGLAPEHVADWLVPSVPAAVADLRAAVSRKLSEWGFDKVAFSTELILSELITNAIRHANGPIKLRLLREGSLICEVYDSSSTSPRLRHAGTSDEGGRGLFIVTQLAERWGTRYTGAGKVIWTEQLLP